MSLVQQSQIPTLSLLYTVKRLLPVHAQQPFFAGSKLLNDKVGLIRADITSLELPNGAIVNAANRRLLGGGGVDGAIHRAAGPGLLQECRTLGGAHTGEAKITDAYRLPCRKVIHTVGPVYEIEEDPQGLLASCYRRSLELAVENGLNTIAFAAVSTGIYGYPSAKVARVALRTVREFLETDDGRKLDLVVFCNFEMKDVDAYHKMTPLYFPPETPADSGHGETKKDAKPAVAPAGAESKVEQDEDATPAAEGAGEKTEKAEDNVEDKVKGKTPVDKESAVASGDEDWVKV